MGSIPRTSPSFFVNREHVELWLNRETGLLIFLLSCEIPHLWNFSVQNMYTTTCDVERRAVLGSEPRTSRTRSENHTTRPNSQSGDNEGGGGSRFLLTLASHGSQNVRNVDAFAINRNELGYRKNKKKSHHCQQCQECPNLRWLFGAMLGSLSLHVVMVANFPLVSQYYTVQPPTLISQDSRNINKPVSLFNLN